MSQPEPEYIEPTHTVINEQPGMGIVWEKFAPRLAMVFENTVFANAERYSNRKYTEHAYSGGSWTHKTYSNGAICFVPASDRSFELTGDGDVIYVPEGITVSADAFGIIVCLFVYSNMAFWAEEKGHTALMEWLSAQYHLLRDAVYSGDGHPERNLIAQADD
ncbi:hypothetical protein A3709_19490 [Halioglobus sp. HI00S01]|uniref:antirestriction protein n=1 Tax=Halioglobus sp. HI00S01 TaxID=1822214 RepID=UPI0007C2343F|nr:antirestriction protein [Halioglobus sp. HI00S01]KZX57809.1 hypothetical protein A3709_19490 [Halioglobus sp. HI00S01]